MCAELLAEKSFLRLHLRLVASGFLFFISFPCRLTPASRPRKGQEGFFQQYLNVPVVVPVLQQFLFAAELREMGNKKNGENRRSRGRTGGVKKAMNGN